MAVDKIKPLKIENPALGGTQTDLFPTEANPTQDYVAGKGFAFENSDNHLIDRAADGQLQYKDTVQTTYKKFNDIWKRKPWHIFTGKVVVVAGSIFSVASGAVAEVQAADFPATAEINGTLTVNSNSQVTAESGSSILIKAV